MGGTSQGCSNFLLADKWEVDGDGIVVDADKERIRIRSIFSQARKARVIANDSANNASVRNLPVDQQPIELVTLGRRISKRASVDTTVRVLPDEITVGIDGHRNGKRYIREEIKGPRVGHPRHTYSQALRDLGVDQATIEFTTGHKDQSMLFGTYATEVGLDRLREAVNKLDFGF